MPFSVMGFPPHHCSPQRNRRGPVPPRGFFFSGLRPRADEFRLRSSDLGTGVKTRPMSLSRLDHPSPQAAGNLPACSVQPYRDARQDCDDVAACTSTWRLVAALIARQALPAVNTRSGMLHSSTLLIDDPCNDDELMFPSLAIFRNGDNPAATELDISGEFSKTITAKFGVTLSEDWIHLKSPLGDQAGFGNLGTSFKYEFVRDGQSQTVLSAALIVDWGGTGSKTVGAESFTTLTPTWYAGKGFNFLPESMKFFRPFGVTTVLGYSFPIESSTTEFDQGLLTAIRNPQFLVWGGSLQYSMSYLKSNVQDLGLPDFVNHLIPVVEWNFETQMANFNDQERTTGTINPGVAYLGEKIQLSVEAIIPVNSGSGDEIGVVAALHLHTDEIFPNTLGRPLFGAAPESED
jgi:hypothetical protein